MKARPGFSLTEILTATTILSVLFAIMFGILQQTSRGWQAANRKVEASQVARMALEQIARDLEFCVAVATSNVALPGGTVTNYAFGFVHHNESAVTDTLSSANATLAPPNDQIFVATPNAASISSGEADLAEAGYLPVRATQSGSTMKAGRYYLLRHWYPASTNSDYDILSNPAGWEKTPLAVGGTSKRQVFVENCMRFNVDFLYSTNRTNSLQSTNLWGRPTITGTGATATVAWTGNPVGVTGLPRAAEITLSVLDERTAERLARLVPGGLAAEDLGKIPDDLESLSREDVKATLREGLTTFRRQVTFRNGQP